MDAEIDILVGPGKECLLGTDLLNPHRLEIDFRTRTVRLIGSRNLERRRSSVPQTQETWRDVRLADNVPALVLIQRC